MFQEMVIFEIGCFKFRDEYQKPVEDDEFVRADSVECSKIDRRFMVDQERRFLLEKIGNIFISKRGFNKISDIPQPEDELSITGVISDTFNFCIKAKPFKQVEYLILLFRKGRTQDHFFLQVHVCHKRSEFVFNGVCLMPHLFQTFFIIVRRNEYGQEERENQHNGCEGNP